MTDVENLCRKLKPIIGGKADELWYEWLASDWRTRKNLEIEIEMIAEKLLKKGPLENETILLSPPAEEDAGGDFVLGRVVYHDKKLFPLYLRKEDLIRQVGIFSITGGGKTNLSLLLALQLLKKDVPFMVIDWKRQWRSMLSLGEFPELKKVQVYTIGRDVVPFLWNPFRPPPNVDCRTWISVLVECLEKSHLAGLGVGDFFIRIYEKLFRELKNKDFYPNFYDGMRELEKMKVGGREFLWWQSTKRIFKSFIFGPSAKSFNTRNPIKLEELLEKPVIFELDQELPKPLRIFFSEIILRFIHLYRLSQGDTDNLRHVLFLEEIHNLFQKIKYEKDRIDSLENVYREIRSFGQGLVGITQHPSLLPVYILGNSQTLIFLPLQHEADIESARRAMFLSRDEEQYLNMSKTGQGIVKIKDRVSPCLVQFLYVPVKKGAITDNILRLKVSGYLPPDYDEKPREKDSFLPPDKDKGEERGKKVKNRQRELLIDIFKFPLSSTSRRYERLKINPKFGNKYKNELVAEGLIRPKKIALRNCRIILFELTHKGKAVLRDLGYHVKDEREGIIHKFWKDKVAQYYKNKNYQVLVEERVNSKPDIIVMNGSKKVAIEIETGNSDAIGNIESNLKAGFDEIVCVATDKEVAEKIGQRLNEKNISSKKITIIPVSALNI